MQTTAIRTRQDIGFLYSKERDPALQQYEYDLSG